MALKPGVVSGEDYITLVNACKDGGYALAAVNCVGTNSVNAVMEAATKNNSDIIIQFSNGGAQFYAGQGMEDSFRQKSSARYRPPSMFIFWRNIMASVWFCIRIMPIGNWCLGLMLSLIIPRRIIGPMAARYIPHICSTCQKRILMITWVSARGFSPVWQNWI